MTIVPNTRPTSDEYDLTEDQEAEIEESIAQIERGDFVDWDDVRDEFLRRNP